MKRELKGLFCEDAFTLLELLIVLVIIGVVAAGVVPKVGGGLDSLKFKTETKRIAALMRYARSRAVSENRPFYVMIDTQSNQMMLVADKETKGAVYPWDLNFREMAPEIYASFNLYSGMQERVLEEENQTSTGKFQFAFYSTGGTSGGTLVLQTDKQQQYIIVDRFSGNIRIADREDRVDKKKRFF